ncbi:MAG: bifunctional phosphopantothenoylcysteine decarboxylase/phosphopantothenate--cysteine ligase CoaBC [Oscillospiraceae bacterium]|jgi:phosphopantothenoylcysteine decarboxylase/phosphopantothenate--cysteine ligase|nr:bifunctional phosphopantothenoylcysteine decarboxylase/phosphopantothenate--cysteine ligase CoaBC [Oscillospiraceae bacterium]
MPDEIQSNPARKFNIILAVTGGIAAYKAVDVARSLVKNGVSVEVVMTKSATEFVTPLTFQTISGNPVSQDMFASLDHWDIAHVSMAKKADLIIVAPCTANTMAKIANGIADNLLTSTVLATRAPILLAPAMNDGMWDNASTQKNVKTLAERGFFFVGPEKGALANGSVGIGRMADPRDIVTRAIHLLVDKRDLSGKKVIVTAGPTIEYLDPVRFISNRSSGKMGYAVAERAIARGAEVTLISGPVHIPPPPCVELIEVETTLQLFKVLMQRCASADAVIQAAAPCDFRPSELSDRKIKKREGLPLNLELTENPDVAAGVGGRKHAGQILVTFAAETENLIENGKAKMVRKNADIMVANNVLESGAGFDVDTNVVSIITKDKFETFPLMSKLAVADIILDKVAALMV